jgi:hypothetical protein
VHRPFAPPQPALELSLAWPHGQMSTAARSFLMIVTDTAAALEMMRNGPRSMASSAHLTSSAAARSIDSPDAIGTLIP